MTIRYTSSTQAEHGSYNGTTHVLSGIVLLRAPLLRGTTGTGAAALQPPLAFLVFQLAILNTFPSEAPGILSAVVLGHLGQEYHTRAGARKAPEVCFGLVQPWSLRFVQSWSGWSVW